MPFLRSLRRKISKSLAVRGVTGTALFAAKHAMRLVGARRAREMQPSHDSTFDSQFGVSTAGVIPLSELDLDQPNWIHGSQYQAVGSDVDFADLLAPLTVQPAHFTFVDLGSGKGRALLLASRVPFRRVVGIELSRELHEVARENLRRWPVARQGCSEIELVCADAGGYVFPDGPLVIFMYNPFGQPVMEGVIRNLVRSFTEQPRRVIVIYFTPRLLELWQAVPFLEVVREAPGYAVLDVRRALQ